MEIYLVMADTNGAHEADCLYSVWSNKKEAKKEIKRLNKSGISLGCYNGRAGLKTISVNKSYNEFQELF